MYLYQRFVNIFLTTEKQGVYRCLFTRKFHPINFFQHTNAEYVFDKLFFKNVGFMIENRPLVYIKKKNNECLLFSCFDLEHYAKSYLYVYLNFSL